MVSKKRCHSLRLLEPFCFATKRDLGEFCSGITPAFSFHAGGHPTIFSMFVIEFAWLVVALAVESAAASFWLPLCLPVSSSLLRKLVTDDV